MASPHQSNHNATNTHSHSAIVLEVCQFNADLQKYHSVSLTILRCPFTSASPTPPQIMVKIRLNKVCCLIALCSAAVETISHGLLSQQLIHCFCLPLMKTVVSPVEYEWRTAGKSLDGILWNATTQRVIFSIFHKICRIKF